MDRTGLARWLLEVHVDRRWYELRRSPEPIPAPGRPRTVALSPDELPDRTLLLGRGPQASGVGLDLRPDNGVSRRHAELQHVDGHWFVTDLGSHNGTWLSDDDARLPRRRLSGRARLGDGVNLFVGSWTRLVLRRVQGPAEPPAAPAGPRLGHRLRRHVPPSS